MSGITARGNVDTARITLRDVRPVEPLRNARNASEVRSTDEAHARDDARIQVPRRTDVHVADGVIVGIGAAPDGFVADRVIEGRGGWLAPGLVDLSARMREPGMEYRATLSSELRAAVAGGVTSVVCPPDTDPPLDEPGLVEVLRHRARALSLARLHPLGALTVKLRGESITEMAELTEAGCVGLSQSTTPIADTTVLLRAMQYAHTFGLKLWLHPVDPHVGRGGVAHSGAYAARMGLAGVPVIAETLALLSIFELVRATRCPVHLCRLSSGAGVELVRAAKAEGLPVTADVAVHHLHLCDVDIGWYDSRLRVDPPFRSVRDRQSIRAALLDGTLDAVCSDHTPVDEDAKALPFGEAEPGVTALELLLPLMLKWAEQERVPLQRALSLVTHGPARIAQLPEPALRTGAPADLCLFDPQEAWVVDSRTLRSQGHDTPYFGRELIGRNRCTLVAGRVVHER